MRTVLQKAAMAATLAMSLCAAGAANALTYSYSTDGTNFTAFNPIATAQTGAEFYGYNGPLSTPSVPFPLVADHAQVWLHENTATGDLSLGVVLDASTSIDGGKATLNFDGLPAGTGVLFMDDPFEDGVHVTSAPTATHEMGWMTGRQDALILGNFGGFFEITLDVTNYWLKGWALLDGPDGNSPFSHDLGKFSNTLTIRASNISSLNEAAVPVPAGVLLLATAMAGLAGLELRRRR